MYFLLRYQRPLWSRKQERHIHCSWWCWERLSRCIRLECESAMVSKAEPRQGWIAHCFSATSINDPRDSFTVCQASYCSRHHPLCGVESCWSSERPDSKLQTANCSFIFTWIESDGGHGTSWHKRPFLTRILRSHCCQIIYCYHIHSCCCHFRRFGNFCNTNVEVCNAAAWPQTKRRPRINHTLFLYALYRQQLSFHWQASNASLDALDGNVAGWMWYFKYSSWLNRPKTWVHEITQTTIGWSYGELSHPSRVALVLSLQAFFFWPVSIPTEVSTN